MGQSFCDTSDVWLDNIALNRIDDKGRKWIVSDIEGWWGLPEPEVPNDPRPFSEDGSYYVAGRYGPRVITLSGYILPGSGGVLDVVEARNELNRTFNAVRRVAVLRVNENPDKQAYVQLVGRPLTAFEKIGNILKFNAQFRAVDPRKYSVAETSLEGYLENAIVQEGRIYNKVFNYVYGAASSSGIMEVNNVGSYPSFATLRIRGPVDQPMVEHVESGSYIALDMSILTGQYVDINLQNRTILFQGTESRRNKLIASSKWFKVEPGMNTIRFYGVQNPPARAYSPLRVNLATNPSAETSTTNWAASAGTGGVVTTSRPNTGGASGSEFFRQTWTTGTSSPSGHTQYTHDFGSDQSYQTYNVSMWVRTSVTKTLFMSAIPATSGGVGLSPIRVSNSITAAPNIWYRMSMSVTLPSTAQRLTVRVETASTSTNWATGQTLDADAVLIEALTPSDLVRTNLVLNPLPLTGVPLNWGFEAGDGATLVTDTGRPALQVTQSVANSFCYATPLGAGTGGRYTSSDTDIWRFQVEVKVLSNLRIRTSIDAYDAGGAEISEIASDTRNLTPADGWVTVSITGSPSLGGTVTARPIIEAYNSGTMNNPSSTGALFLVRRALVLKGTTIGDYFDGDTLSDAEGQQYYWSGLRAQSQTLAYAIQSDSANTYFDGNYATATWNGTANASASTQAEIEEIPAAVLYLTYRSAWIE